MSEIQSFLTFCAKPTTGETNAAAQYRRRAESIIIPIGLSGVSLEEAILEIQRAGKKYSSDGVGINIAIDYSPIQPQKDFVTPKSTDPELLAAFESLKYEYNQWTQRAIMTPNLETNRAVTITPHKTSVWDALEWSAFVSGFNYQVRSNEVVIGHFMPSLTFPLEIRVYHTTPKGDQEFSGIHSYESIGATNPNILICAQRYISDRKLLAVLYVGSDWDNFEKPLFEYGYCDLPDKSAGSQEQKK